jgi:CARDB
MKRGFLAGLVAAGSVAAGSVAAASVLAVSSYGSTPSVPRARLVAFKCQPAIEPSQREVAVEAVMRPLDGTRKMALRFTLLSRIKGQTITTQVAGHDLGNWVTPPNPTLGQRPGDVWIVDHPVLGLSAPAYYRFRVTYRWTGLHARVLGTAVRQTPQCFQPELRPNLLVESITVMPASNAAMDDYVTAIANTGATGAGPFEVLFAPGGGLSVQTRTIARLRAHTSRTLTFVGPECTVETDPTVTVDPDHQVNDVNPTDNSLTATCPGMSSTPSSG